MEDSGFIGEFDDRRTLRLDVYHRYSDEVVWGALADPHQAVQWFMLVPIEPRPGAEVMFRSVSRAVDTGMRGTVTEFDPPRALEYEFREVFDSILRFELRATGGGCRLSFTQRLAPNRVWTHDPDGTDRTVGPEAAPGWQDFLIDSLSAFLAGTSLPAPAEVAERKLIRTEQCRSLLADRFG